MNEPKNLVTEYREDAQLTLNQVSKLSGIASSYLQQVEENKINMPGREPLIRLALSMNRDLNQIDALLKHYSHADLNESDVDIFLMAAAKQNISSVPVSRIHGINIISSVMALELMTCESETFMITSQPYWPIFTGKFFKFVMSTSKSRIFKPSKHDGLSFLIYERINAERSRIFFKKAENTPIHHLICEGCFQDYFKSIKKIIENPDNIKYDVDVESFFNEIKKVLRNTKYELLLSKNCCSNEISISRNSKSDKPVVLFTGRHEISKRHPMNLDSLGVIITESNDFYNMFKREYDVISRNLITENNSETIDYIENLITA